MTLRITVVLPLSAFLGLLPCCVSTLSLLYVPCVTNCILAFAWLGLGLGLGLGFRV